MNHTDKNTLIKQLSVSEQGKLISFLKQWMISREDARDIVQEVFYSLIVGFEDIKDLEKITSWLYTTARYKAIDFIRKKKPTTVSELEHSEQDNQSFFDWIESYGSENQITEMWKEEVYLVLDRSLAQMPKEQRDAFVLHELEGKPISEIADLKKVPVNTILSRKRYAVTKLKCALQSLYYELKEN